MKIETVRFGPWRVACLPEDGARLAGLWIGDLSLLTLAPVDFRPPTRDFGHYETRPTYGYDDCFPTIDPCRYPIGSQQLLPDHGELCWLPWQVRATTSELQCVVQSQVLPVRFCRTMKFTPSSIDWRFEVFNESASPLPFLHAMHALMPLSEIVEMELPRFGHATEDMQGVAASSTNPNRLAEHLLNLPQGKAEMLFLREIKQGEFTLRFRPSTNLRVTFPLREFPTLGIWWNHMGYPDEDGVRRAECAFEPIAGAFSSLAKSHEHGQFQTVMPGEPTTWTVRWEIVSDT